ncbi:hypothetical protein K491DRAFT_254978 [Lophiostoma macrostomum CBS 122681]|uniref:Uncharacterized protein n=1 Tax=Lophiostoma macrostomum CBS 122681 TaxID=1314788 RepID=A0A6A6SKX0_9PLEO|nr:hypothetical protein K491DRAFT_254978 [Lophiostoma macrostomum CBS 122681]
MPRYHGGDRLDPDHVSMAQIDHIQGPERMDAYIDDVEFGEAMDKQFRNKLKKRSAHHDPAEDKKGSEAAEDKKGSEAAGDKLALEASDPQSAFAAGNANAAHEAGASNAALAAAPASIAPDDENDEDLEFVVMVKGKNAVQDCMGLGPYGFFHNSPILLMQAKKAQDLIDAQEKATQVFHQDLLSEDGKDTYVKNFPSKEATLRAEFPPHQRPTFTKTFEFAKAMSKYGSDRRSKIMELKTAFDAYNASVTSLIQDNELTHAELITAQRDAQYFQNLNSRNERPSTQQELEHHQDLRQDFQQDISKQMAAYDALINAGLQKINEGRVGWEADLD